MAAVASNSYGWVICHETYINKIYNKTKWKNEVLNYVIDPNTFEICVPFRKSVNQHSVICDEAKQIKTAYDSLYELFISNKFRFKFTEKSNSNAREIARKFYDDSRHPVGEFLGGNESDEPVLATIGEDDYLIPAECNFYSYDIKNVRFHLKGKLYHFILLDPPWWNKFIRRKRKANSNMGYNMLYDDELKKLPINELLHDDGLVGVWCTSAPSHINSVLNDLFPAWDLTFVSQWFWLKVTKEGKPICAFTEHLGKQPYERILFGVKKNSCRDHSIPENNKVIMSVPSAIHSHKPPLCELLKDYIPDNAECLELFARYLLPKWTSYGNEVLKLQHSSLYIRNVGTNELVSPVN